MEEAVRDPHSTTPYEIIRRGIFDTNMRYFTVMADAEMARDLLGYNIPPSRDKGGTNRSPSKVKIAEYTGKMTGGEWYLNPQPLIFLEANEQGIVEQGDGQQRLMGLIAASQTNPDLRIPLVVCVDAPPISKMVVDQGKPRQLADWLKMAGKPNSAQLSYAIKMLRAIKEQQPFVSVPMWRNAKLTPTEQAAFLDKHPRLEQGLSIAKDCKSLAMQYVVAVVWYLLAEEYDAFKAAEFLNGLEKGANLGIDDPRLKLREYLSKMRYERYPWDGFEQLGVLITAVNAWLTGNERYKASGSFTLRNKRFPELIPSARLPEPLFTKP